MKIEQDKSVEISGKAKALIVEFMEAEEVVVFGYGYKVTSKDERENERQKLEGAKQKVHQMIASLGNSGFSIFLGELEKLEQEANRQYDSGINEYWLAGQSDPNLGDFYNNECNASSIQLGRDLKLIDSVRSFLQKPLIPQITP